MPDTGDDRFQNAAVPTPGGSVTTRAPALDGLRGCAVLLVIAGHAAQPQHQGLSAAGVTLFFVLSG